MVDGTEARRRVAVDRVFLDLENPRHEPYQSQDEVIEYLCKEELTLEIAKDIAKNGLNPLELFALIPENISDPEQNGTFITAEGNRRVCALKLLRDPDLAPADKRKSFENAAEGWTPIRQISAVVFDDRDAVKLWRDRTHSGLAGGIGRKQWNAEQKARHTGDNNKNIIAQFILDYMEEKGFITPQERKGRLSTVQRYLSNPNMRDALGININDLDNISRIRPLEEFEIILKKFAEDIVNRIVTTRDNAERITKYSHKLRILEGVKGETIQPRPLDDDLAKETKSKSKKQPQKPEKPKRIRHSPRIRDALDAMENYKLVTLYHSICIISLREHTPILAIGVWAFMETLTANAGRQTGQSFPAFLTNDLLIKFGLGRKKDVKTIREIVDRISGYGNSTKHHETSAAFNGEQLANDVETLETLILRLAETAKDKTVEN